MRTRFITTGLFSIASLVCAAAFSQRQYAVQVGEVSYWTEPNKQLDDDALAANACMNDVFPCNANTELCCFFAQDSNRDGSITGETDYNLSWCCPGDDGCGLYPYTCGPNGQLPPSLNITKTKPPADVGPACGPKDVVRLRAV